MRLAHKPLHRRHHLTLPPAQKAKPISVVKPTAAPQLAPPIIPAVQTVKFNAAVVRVGVERNFSGLTKTPIVPARSSFAGPLPALGTPAAGSNTSPAAPPAAPSGLAKFFQGIKNGVVATGHFADRLLGGEQPGTPAPPDAQGLKFSDTKSAANLAYTAHVNDVYQFPDGANPNGKNWRVVDVGEDQNTGFRAIALKPEDPNDKRTIVAFAGTDDISDWGSNLGQAKGEVPPQYLEALAFGNKWKNTDGDNVILTGHSLGGGLAGFVAGQTGLRATALNSAPLALDNLGGNPLRYEVRNNPRITQYYVPGEVLTNLDNASPLDTRPGNQIAIEGKYPAPTDPLSRLIVPIKNHMIGSAVLAIPDPKQILCG